AKGEGRAGHFFTENPEGSERLAGGFASATPPVVHVRILSTLEGCYNRLRDENYFPRVPSHSRVCQSPDQSDSTFPLTVSPVILPLYLAVTFRPSRSRITLKVISSSAILPSWIGVSFSLRTVAPVSLSPSCLSLSVPSMRLP